MLQQTVLTSLPEPESRALPNEFVIVSSNRLTVETPGTKHDCIENFWNKYGP